MDKTFLFKIGPRMCLGYQTENKGEDEGKTKGMEIEIERVPLPWWWDGLNDPQQAQWLHSTLSELERNNQDLLALIQEEDSSNNSSTQRTVVKKAQDFHRLFRSLASHLNSHLLLRHQLPSPDSIPESGVEDPELDSSAKSSPQSTDEMSSEFSDRNTLVEEIGDKSVVLRLMEESSRHLKELTRRNEEKREIIRELSSRIEKLMAENRRLVQQQKQLVDENGRLHLKAMNESRKGLDRCSRSSRTSTRQNASHLARLKSLILGSIWGGDSE